MKNFPLSRLEIERLGAWMIGGIACLCLQELFWMLWDAILILPTWHSLPLSQAIRIYWHGFAYCAYWLSPTILGVITGITGWLTTGRETVYPLFYSWRGLSLLSVGIFFIGCVYQTFFLYYTNQPVVMAWNWLWTPTRWWRILLFLLIQILFLRLMPEVANGLALLFERIRARWLL